MLFISEYFFANDHRAYNYIQTATVGHIKMTGATHIVLALSLPGVIVGYF